MDLLTQEFVDDYKKEQHQIEETNKKIIKDISIASEKLNNIKNKDILGNLKYQSEKIVYDTFYTYLQSYLPEIDPYSIKINFNWSPQNKISFTVDYSQAMDTKGIIYKSKFKRNTEFNQMDESGEYFLNDFGGIDDKPYETQKQLNSEEKEKYSEYFNKNGQDIFERANFFVTNGRKNDIYVPQDKINNEPLENIIQMAKIKSLSSLRIVQPEMNKQIKQKYNFKN